MPAFVIWVQNFIQALSILQPILVQVMKALNDPAVENAKLHDIATSIKVAVTDEERKNGAINLVNYSFDRE